LKYNIKGEKRKNSIKKQELIVLKKIGFKKHISKDKNYHKVLINLPGNNKIR
jgi:hypothetical protein